jgi:hypothetical protein
MLMYGFVFDARPTEPIRSIDVRPPGWKTFIYLCHHTLPYCGVPRVRDLYQDMPVYYQLLYLR